MPSGRVIGQHLRGDAQDGDVEQIVQQGEKLAEAGQVPLDQLNAGACAGVGVSDLPAGGELEDVGDTHDVGFRVVLHPLGQGEQLPRVLEKSLAAGGEGDMAAVADKQRRTQLVLELADLLGQRGLADVELRGGPPEVQLIGDGHEVAQQPQIKVHIPLASAPAGRYGLPVGRTLPGHNRMAIDPGETCLGRRRCAACYIDRGAASSPDDRKRRQCQEGGSAADSDDSWRPSAARPAGGCGLAAWTVLGDGVPGAAGRPAA